MVHEQKQTDEQTHNWATKCGWKWAGKKHVHSYTSLPDDTQELKWNKCPKCFNLLRKVSDDNSGDDASSSSSSSDSDSPSTCSWVKAACWNCILGGTLHPGNISVGIAQWQIDHEDAKTIRLSSNLENSMGGWPGLQLCWLFCVTFMWLRTKKAHCWEVWHPNHFGSSLGAPLKHFVSQPPFRSSHPKCLICVPAACWNCILGGTLHPGNISVGIAQWQIDHEDAKTIRFSSNLENSMGGWPGLQLCWLLAKKGHCSNLIRDPKHIRVCDISFLDSMKWSFRCVKTCCSNRTQLCPLASCEELRVLNSLQGSTAKTRISTRCRFSLWTRPFRDCFQSLQKQHPFFCPSLLPSAGRRSWVLLAD